MLSLLTLPFLLAPRSRIRDLKNICVRESQLGSDQRQQNHGVVYFEAIAFVLEQ